MGRIRMGRGGKGRGETGRVEEKLHHCVACVCVLHSLQVVLRRSRTAQW